VGAPPRNLRLLVRAPGQPQLRTMSGTASRRVVVEPTVCNALNVARLTREVGLRTSAPMGIIAGNVWSRQGKTLSGSMRDAGARVFQSLGVELSHLVLGRIIVVRVLELCRSICCRHTVRSSSCRTRSPHICVSVLIPLRSLLSITISTSPEQFYAAIDASEMHF
jgi:hypothetical protein